MLIIFPYLWVKSCTTILGTCLIPSAQDSHFSLADLNYSRLLLDMVRKL